MNTFELRFGEEIKTERDFAPIMRFNNRRTRFNGNFCFVEGDTDEFFYKNCKVPVLSSNCEYVFRKFKEQDDDERFKELIGKESVLYCYSKIKKNEILVAEMRRCIFIIDYDFEGIYSSQIDLDMKDNNNITVTPYHSQESFFFVEENIREIFTYLGLSNEECLRFINELYEFAYTTVDFFALRGVISFNLKNKSIHRQIYEKIDYHRNYDNNEIFIFNFDKKPLYNYHLLSEEVQYMKNAIKYKPRANENYHTNIKRISTNPPLYIRGHNVYDFLRDYLVKIHNTKLYEHKKGIIKVLNITMLIVNGNGEELYNPNTK